MVEFWEQMARMNQSTKHLKQQYAFRLYCSNEHTRKEIAEMVGITESTLRSWIDKGKWDDYAVSLSMSKDAQLKTMMNHLKEQNAHISNKPEGQRYPNTQEADAIMKVTKAIKALETELGVSETVNVMRPFLAWARQQDSELATQLKNLADRYIKTLLQ